MGYQLKNYMSFLKFDTFRLVFTQILNFASKIKKNCVILASVQYQLSNVEQPLLTNLLYHILGLAEPC